MENVLSAATKWVTKGLAAAVLVVMYALGMGASAPAAAHGYHCNSVYGPYTRYGRRRYGWHQHCGYYEPGVNLWFGRGRRRRGRGRRRR
jgi:hypothetical protein